MMTDGKVLWNELDEAYDTAVVCNKQYPMHKGIENCKKGNNF